MPVLSDLKHCERCGKFGDHEAKDHPWLPLTAAAHKWYRELNTYPAGGTRFEMRYSKYPWLHALRLEDAGLVVVQRVTYYEWWIQRVDRASEPELEMLLRESVQDNGWRVWMTEASRERVTARLESLST